MSDTILSARWVVHYESESRRKQLIRDTSVSPATIDTVQQLYSALMDLFDEAVPASESTPMKFDTPVQYKVGIIDSGDKDPWFIDRTSVEYLKGGSLETVGWARVQGSNVGIVTVQCTGTFGILAGDVGNTISHADGDAGVLLDVDVTNKVLTIRPTTYAAGNNWDSTSGTITCNGHTATQSAAAVTGEQVWANIYSTGLATLQPNTTLRVFQNAAAVTRYKASTTWWGLGDIDLLIPMKTTAGASIDGGYLTVQARRGLTTYSTFIASVGSGGRNPIPLSCAVDLNNTEGNRQMVLTTASDEFVAGEVITDDSNSDIKGVVTSSTGTAPNVTIQYYLIGDVQTDFASGTGGFTGGTSGATATAVDPTDVNGAAVAGCSITHGVNETFDIDEDGTTENYSIVLDCNDNTVADVYTWLQYITQDKQTGTSNTDGVQGQQYLGSDYRIAYVTLTGTVGEGSVVTQVTSGASGTVVAHNTTDKYLILRNSRGTFDNTNEVRIDASNKVATPTCTVITPLFANPFGMFAGGTLFCAPGVVLDNVPTTDVNKYQLTDDQGNTITAPLKVTATVGNTREGDWVAVFELTAVGGSVKKDTYTIDAGQGAAGSTTIKVDPAIASKTVGKITGGGIVRVVSDASGHEHRYRYTSWSGDTFTLFNLTGLTADGSGCSQTVLSDAGATFVSSGVRRGDCVRNVTEGTYAYVVSVDSETQLTTTNRSSDMPVTNWTSDSYEVGTTIDSYTTDDTAYCPFIDTYETTGTDGTPGSESAAVTYAADMPVRVKCRQAGDIVPYSGDSKIESTGMSINVIRTADTVYS